MKRQRVVGVSGFPAAAEMAAATSAKKKKPNQKTAVHEEEDEEQQKNKKKMAEEGGGGEENGRGLVNNYWDQINYWPGIGDFVDEQMSWGSVWFPFWGLDFSGDAFGALYGDVVWNDDLWNLKNQIPNP